MLIALVVDLNKASYELFHYPGQVIVCVIYMCIINLSNSVQVHRKTETVRWRGVLNLQGSEIRSIKIPSFTRTSHPNRLFGLLEQCWSLIWLTPPFNIWSSPHHITDRHSGVRSSSPPSSFTAAASGARGKESPATPPHQLCGPGSFQGTICSTPGGFLPSACQRRRIRTASCRKPMGSPQSLARPRPSGRRSSLRSDVVSLIRDLIH